MLAAGKILFLRRKNFFYFNRENRQFTCSGFGSEDTDSCWKRKPLRILIQRTKKYFFPYEMRCVEGKRAESKIIGEERNCRMNDILHWCAEDI